jgi:hypothetical protein
MAEMVVERLSADGESAWATFLESSNDGTLFHDLRFLAYHPPERFQFEHLVVRREGKLFALLPGGTTPIDGTPVFCSPLGASVGGLATGAKLALADTLEAVGALQHFAREAGWAGIQMTLAPSIYQRRPSQTVAFALEHHGFRLERRWLCEVVPLETGEGPRYSRLFRSTYANLVRQGSRKGMTVIDGGIERFDEFLAPFRDTYERCSTESR